MIELVETVVLVLLLDLVSEVSELHEVFRDVGDFVEVRSDLRDVQVHQVRVVPVQLLHLLIGKRGCVPVVLDVHTLMRGSHGRLMMSISWRPWIEDLLMSLQFVGLDVQEE